MAHIVSRTECREFVIIVRANNLRLVSVSPLASRWRCCD